MIGSDMSNELSTQNKTFDLSPQTFDQALTFANYLADSDMVPKDFKGKPGNCLIAMQWGMEVGLKPLQALQNIAVINGRPSLWGDALIAIVRSSPLCEYVQEEMKPDGTAICRAKRRGESEQTRTFSDADAKTAGLSGKQGPWMTSPKRMKQLRARAFALRDVFPDVLKGMPMAEEVMDIPQEPRTEAERAEHVDVQMFIDMVPECKTDAEAAKLWADHNGKLAKQPQDHAQFKAAVIAHRTALKNASATDVQPKAVKTDAPEVTLQLVLDKLNAAKTEDALNVAGDWINALTDPAEIQQCSDRYDERLAEMRGL